MVKEKIEYGRYQITIEEASKNNTTSFIIENVHRDKDFWFSITNSEGFLGHLKFTKIGSSDNFLLSDIRPGRYPIQDLPISD